MIEYRRLEREDPKYIYSAIEKLCDELFKDLSNMELNYDLPSNVGELWLRSYSSSLNKLSVIFYALSAEKIIGYVAGNISISPAYLGGRKIGVLAHIYIDPAFRRRSFAAGLMDRVENWFVEQGVDKYECEVLIRNEKSFAFFTKSVGYKVTSLKLIKG